jgi:hypothetical protein
MPQTEEHFNDEHCAAGTAAAAAAGHPIHDTARHRRRYSTLADRFHGDSGSNCTGSIAAGTLPARPELHMGPTHEKSMGTGRPRMPSLPGTYENRGSDQLSQRHSKDSQLSGPTVAGAAHRRSRSNVFRSTGMVLKQRRVTLLWASCAHSGHDCHLPRGIGPCSPRSNPSRAAPASRSRRSQRLPATRSTLCLHGSSSVHPLIFLTIRPRERHNQAVRPF